MNNIHLIKEFLNLDNDIYKVLDTGEILTKISLQGHITNRFRSALIFNESSGYYQVRFKDKRLQVHRIIFQKFHGELNPDLVINHIDGCKTNNNASNLEQITHSGNMLHKYSVIGHRPVIGHTKITKEIAEKIRADRELGMKYSELIEKYSICKSNISYIINNKTWN